MCLSTDSCTLSPLPGLMDRQTGQPPQHTDARRNFAPAEKLYFLSFLRIMMVGKLKSPAIARNKLFRVKNVDFLPNHKVFSVKMHLKSNIGHTID